MNNEALAHNIRGWVHYDNMAAALQKQITNARGQRDTFENHIQALLKQQHMTNAVIQISGGQLQLQEEKSTSGLTMKSLQESVLSFFKSRPELCGGSVSTLIHQGAIQTTPEKLAAELLNHIKQERVIHTTLKLKKLKAAPGPV